MRPLLPNRLLESIYDTLLSRLGLGMLALALLINLGALLSVDRGIEKFVEARERAVQSRTVMFDVQTVQSMLYESESAQRGFLYTGNKDYLKPMNENEGQITSKFASLRDALKENPAQQQQLARIHTITLEKIADLNKTVAVQQMGQTDAAREIVMSDQGKKLMDAIDQEMGRFMGQQDQVRQGWLKQRDDLLLGIRWGFAAIFGINALLLLAGAMTIMREMANKRAEVVRLDELAVVLASEVAQRAAELRALSAHLLRVQEEERRTIARELHDELGGTLSAVKMDIVMGRDAAAKRSDVKSVARLQRAHASIDSAIQFTRRLIEDLRPTLLDNLGFEAALRAMIEQFCERCNVQCEVALPEGEMNLSSAQSTALYRLCQEALTYVMKYAKAERVAITLTSDGEHWKLILADDGVGLEATKQHRAMSHGLLGMRERMVALEGTFDIRGDAGRGTTLTATFPVAKTETAAL